MGCHLYLKVNKKKIPNFWNVWTESFKMNPVSSAIFFCPWFNNWRIAGHVEVFWHRATVRTFVDTLGLNPGLCNEKPKSNHLRCGVANKVNLLLNICSKKWIPCRFSIHVVVHLILDPVCLSWFKFFVIFVTQWRSWLRHCAASRKVAGLVLIWNLKFGIFHWHNSSGRTMAMRSTKPLTEISTRSISWGVKTVGA